MRNSLKYLAAGFMGVGGASIGFATSFALGLGIACIGIGLVAIADMATTLPEK